MSTHTVPERGNESGSGSDLGAADDVLDAEFVDHDKTEPGDDLGDGGGTVAAGHAPPAAARTAPRGDVAGGAGPGRAGGARAVAAAGRGRPGRVAEVSVAGERSGRAVPVRYVVIAALVHGSGYERLARPGCSDRTIRRRLREWATAGQGTARANDHVFAVPVTCGAVGVHVETRALSRRADQRRGVGG
jgi:hypothetical protein